MLYFDVWSAWYDVSLLQWVLYRPVHRAVMRAVHLLPVEPVRVLDVGCGTARHTRDRALRFPRAEVIGLDVSPGMLAAARRRLGSNAPRLVLADAAAIPLESGSVDLVTSTIAYHWLRDPAPALAEIRRVLRPGGTFVLATIVARVLPGFLLGQRLVTEGRHRRDFETAGLDVLSAERVGTHVCLFVMRSRIEL